jgi:hypothetical protein
LSYDNACKYLAETYPREFARWLLASEPPEIRVLKTELTLEPIRADALSFLRAANRILHLEFQTLPVSKPPMPLRMLDYSVRLKRKYRCSVEQVVIFLQETTNEVAFTEEYRDDTTIHLFCLDGGCVILICLGVFLVVFKKGGWVCLVGGWVGWCGGGGFVGGGGGVGGLGGGFIG